MNTDRIKEIQEATAYPNSTSVMLALKQVWNECEQEKVKNLTIPSVSQQRELLLAFLKYYNNGEVTEYGIKEVDDFLKHNS